MIAKGIIEQHTQIHLSSTSAAIVALETPVIPEFHLVVSGVRVVFATSLDEIVKEARWIHANLHFGAFNSLNCMKIWYNFPFVQWQHQ